MNGKRAVPGARVVAELIHVWVVLGHDRDGVTLLANDEPCLLLSGIAQIYPIILRERNQNECELHNAY